MSGFATCETHRRTPDSAGRAVAEAIRNGLSVLKPTTTESLLLPSGKTVTIQKATPSFTTWRGELPSDSYGNKAVLDFDGRMGFAELVILWTLEKQGWRGVWVDTYRNCFRQDYWNTKRLRELPEADPQALLDKIRQARNGRRAGTWDVFCWRDGKYLFAESKGFGHDKFRRSQLEWLEAALSLGLPLDSFLIVEWNI